MDIPPALIKPWAGMGKRMAERILVATYPIVNANGEVVDGMAINIYLDKETTGKFDRFNAVRNGKTQMIYRVGLNKEVHALIDSNSSIIESVRRVKQPDPEFPATQDDIEVCEEINRQPVYRYMYECVGRVSVECNERTTGGSIDGSNVTAMTSKVTYRWFVGDEPTEQSLFHEIEDIWIIDPE